VLQQIAACRGAINSLLVEIIDGEIRFHGLSKNVRKNFAGLAAEQGADRMIELSLYAKRN
jgi:DNA-binding FrmR family transcriptional regulator